jgi:hypothetical protein
MIQDIETLAGGGEMFFPEILQKGEKLRIGMGTRVHYFVIAWSQGYHQGPSQIQECMAVV